MMAAVFSMQGLGQLAAALVALITTIAFKGSLVNTTSKFSSCHESCQLAGDRAWRIIVGFGAVPAVFALYYRITIPDIRAYVNNKNKGEVDPITQQKIKQSMGKNLAAPKASWRDVFAYFSQWKNFKVIFATTTAWFFLGMYFLPCMIPNLIIPTP
jgi:PHS family inorganic phosphate transporter-like MFS transporter